MFAGEGDFCRAFTVNQRWIFRFAYNDEGSRSLEREAALLPELIGAIRLPIPAITFFGRRQSDGRIFAGHPKIPGVELTRDLLLSLGPVERAQCARDLAGFLSDLHSFDLEKARRSGVPESDYPFCRTEDGIIPGMASHIYRRELERLLGYQILDEPTRRYCERLVDALLDVRQAPALPPALIHGDLSQEHVLFDPHRKRITGVIDFTDVIISDPALDFMYLHHAYGSDFLALLLSYYPQGDPQAITTRVHLLHRWYAVLRLLWALDHDYKEGIDKRLRELSLLRAGHLP